MNIQTICFTKTGYELAKHIEAALGGHEVDVFFKSSQIEFGHDEEGHETTADDLCKKAFEERTALLFIGAAGIAIRKIAPFVKDKLTDPPVLLMDEKGNNIIPLLSGHVGGANELAMEIAAATGAYPVITTATDLNHAFSVDLFAKEHGLEIANREGIARVSVKALSGKPVVLSIKDYPPVGDVDVLVTDEAEPHTEAKIVLRPAQVVGAEANDQADYEKPYSMGIGCKRGKTMQEIEAAVLGVLSENGIDINDIYAIGTIDLKENEEGLIAFGKKYMLPIITFEAKALNRAEGSFSHSDFVETTTGTDNICERAAVLAAGEGAELVVKKTAKEGVTVAVAKSIKGKRMI